MQVKTVVATLVLVVFVVACSRQAIPLSADQLQLIEQALSVAMKERSLNGSVGVCLPARADPDAAFLQRFGPRPFTLSSCPFWTNKFMRKAQWELNVVSAEISGTKAVVNILATEPSGLDGGYYSLEYERESTSWVITRRSFGIT
jgi:hypothetical protein